MARSEIDDSRLGFFVDGDIGLVLESGRIQSTIDNLNGLGSRETAKLHMLKESGGGLVALGEAREHNRKACHSEHEPITMSAVETLDEILGEGPKV